MSDRAPAIVWLLGLSILLGYDLYAFATGRAVTLTSFAVRRIPPWIILPLAGALFIHFLERYSQR